MRFLCHIFFACKLWSPICFRANIMAENISMPIDSWTIMILFFYFLLYRGLGCFWTGPSIFSKLLFHGSFLWKGASGRLVSHFCFFSAPGTSQKIIRVSQKKVFDILDIRGPVKGGGGPTSSWPGPLRGGWRKLNGPPMLFHVLVGVFQYHLRPRKGA